MAATKSLAKLKQQRQEKRETSAAPVADDRVEISTKRPKKPKEVHIGAYGPEEGKAALEELCLALRRERGRKVTSKEIMFEALNDVLKKYGKAPIFPTEEGI